MAFYTLRDVYRARAVISRHIVRTPLRYSKRLSRLLGFDLYLKLENTQITRSFKVRGGLYYMGFSLHRLLKAYVGLGVH